VKFKKLKFLIRDGLYFDKFKKMFSKLNVLKSNFFIFLKYLSKAIFIMSKLFLFLQKKWKGVLTILGGCLVHLVLGSFYLWGNINIYVTSYYRIHSDSSLNMATSSALFCLMAFGISLAFFFGLSFSSKVGFRLSAMIETFLISMSIFVSSYMNNFWLFVLFYGIFFGILSGLLYIIPIFLACQYFPTSKGIISGIITGAYGLATIFSSLLAQNLINPDNEAPTVKEGSDKYFTANVADNLPKFVRYLALYFFFLGFLGSLLFFDPPKKKSEEVHQSINTEEVNQSMNEPFGQKKEENTLKKILKSMKIYHIFLMNLFSSGLGLLIASNFKNYGLLKINDDVFLTIVGSVGAVFNGVGRMIWGILYDKFSFRSVYLFLLSIQIILIATYDLISEFKVSFFIWTCFLLFCLGGHYVLFPSLCLKEFGVENGSKAYPIVYFAFSCSNFLQFGIAYFLKKSIGFSNIYWIFLGLTAVSVVLVLDFKEKKGEEIKKIKEN